MRPFLRQLFLFLGIFAGINALFFWLIWSIYLKEYIFSKEKFDGYSYFLFADSHGLALANGLEKSGLFNFSSASDNYGDINRKLNYVLDHSIKPRAIFLTADDHTLSLYRDRVNNFDRSVYYAKTPFPGIENEWQFFLDKWVRFFIPSFNPKDRGLIRLWTKAVITGSIQQPKYLEIDWSKVKRADSLSLLRAQWQFPSSEASETQKIYLNHLIQRCSNADVPIFGIKFPLTQGYRKHIEGRSYGVDQLLKGKGLTVWDYSQLNWPDSLFENQDHLNASGGEKFRKLLTERLDSLQSESEN